MKKDIIFRMMNIDPRISRIYKILAKICPKFLDLYASIYGNYLLRSIKKSRKPFAQNFDLFNFKKRRSTSHLECVTLASSLFTAFEGTCLFH